MAKGKGWTQADVDRVSGVAKRPKPQPSKGNGKEAQAKELIRLVALDMGMPPPTFEHRFDVGRMWRLDIAWPEHKVAIEIMGGTWTQGRHTRGAGYEGDCEKLNAATLAGWRVLSYTYTMLAKLGARTVLANARRLMA